MAAKTRPLLGGSVACARGNVRDAHRGTRSLGHVGDAGQRGAQILLDIARQRLQRGDVYDPASCLSMARVGGEHQAVKAPEKCGERFASSGGRQDQSGFAARDGGPALSLRSCGAFEYGTKPSRSNGMKKAENILHLVDGGSGRRVVNALWTGGRTGLLPFLCSLSGLGCRSRHGSPRALSSIPVPPQQIGCTPEIFSSHGVVRLYRSVEATVFLELWPEEVGRILRLLGGAQDEIPTGRQPGVNAAEHFGSIVRREIKQNVPQEHQIEVAEYSCRHSGEVQMLERAHPTYLRHQFP